MNSIPLYNDHSDQKLKNILGTDSGFVIPDGYFEELPLSIKIQLGEISELDLSIINKHEYPFSNPVNYFEEVKNRINNSIEQENSFEPIPLLPTNETGFDLPDGYFEQSKYHIIDETKEHKNIVGETKENAFTTDENYFKKSKEHILAQTTKQNKTTVYRSIVWRPSLKTFIRYAAVVTIAFGLGYFSRTKQNIVVYNNHGQLSKPVIIEDITYEELQAALFDEDLDNDDLIDLVNTQQQTASNNNIQKPNTNTKVKQKKDYIPAADKAPSPQQIEQYILDNNEDLNSDEL